MPTSFDREAATADRQARAGYAAASCVRWTLASQTAPDPLARVAALANAREQAEVALHQAIWDALGQRETWRSVAPAAGMPWQTLYRRYRQPPASCRPRRPELTFEVVADLMGADLRSERAAEKVSDD